MCWELAKKTMLVLLQTLSNTDRAVQHYPLIKEWLMLDYYLITDGKKKSRQFTQRFSLLVWLCWFFLGWKTEGQLAGEMFSSGRCKIKINTATSLTRTADICLCRRSLLWDFLSLKGHKLLNPNRVFFLHQHLHVCIESPGSAPTVALTSVSCEGVVVY